MIATARQYKGVGRSLNGDINIYTWNKAEEKKDDTTQGKENTNQPISRPTHNNFTDLGSV